MAKNKVKKGLSPEESRRKKKKFARETLEALGIALILAILIKAFVIQAFKIPSSSMEDTLLIGDHILVSKFSYGIQVPRPAMIKVLGLKVPFFETWLKTAWGGIKRGDVVVFRYPGDREKDYIKRVVALAGETVEVRSKRIYIDGKLWDDPYGIYKGSQYGDSEGDNFGPFTVEEGRIFVMGDNRDRSYDSRFWGTVPVEELRGKAFIIYFSLDGANKWVRFDRFGKIIR